MLLMKRWRALGLQMLATCGCAPASAGVAVREQPTSLPSSAETAPVAPSAAPPPAATAASASPPVAAPQEGPSAAATATPASARQTRRNLKAEISRIIKEQLDVDEKAIKPQSTFVDDLGADSLGLVELVLAFEEAFEIDIPDEDTEHIRTVQDAVDYVSAHLNDTPAELAAREKRLNHQRELFKSPRYSPAVTAPARPSRVAAGVYACRISKQFRFRDCTVQKTADGRTVLEFSSGNLIGSRGLLWTEGANEVFEGALTDTRPFGCAPCDEACSANPAMCSCVPLPDAAVVECVRQPVRMTLKPSDKNSFGGTMIYDVYSSEHVGRGATPRRPGAHIAKPTKFSVEIRPKGTSRP